MKKHIVLLGDSTFDNQAYTDDEPDVISHLQDVLPARWKASLCAVDGSTAQELSAQIGRTAKRASHLIVSVGGNDALMNADILDTPVSSTAEALTLFGQRVDRFEVAYRSAIE
ncbi:MAG: SGNH/GDSL hydrolase family protein, partial [Acidobacteriota bacterium]